MKDGLRIGLGIVVSMALVFAAASLLIIAEMPMWMFWVILAVAMVLLFVPMITLRGDWVTLGEDRIEIRAPLTEVDIPYGSITGVDCVRGFEFGLRTMGYGGIHRGSGDFTNKTVGPYTLAGDDRIGQMIVVSYRPRSGKERYAAFNSVDDATTLEMYRRIREASEAGSLAVSMTPERRRDIERRHRSAKRTVAAVLVIVLAMAAVSVYIGMTSGHVSAYMDGDSLRIDATMVDEDIPLDSIVSVELREDLDYGARTAGLGNSEYLSGKFRNGEFGSYTLAVHRSCDLSIVVHTDSRAVVFNLEDRESTEAFYLDLSGRIGTASWCNGVSHVAVTT